MAKMCIRCYNDYKGRIKIIRRNMPVYKVSYNSQSIRCKNSSKNYNKFTRNLPTQRTT